MIENTHQAPPFPHLHISKTPSTLQKPHPLRLLQHIPNPRESHPLEELLSLPQRLLPRTRRRAVDGELVAHDGLDRVLVFAVEVRFHESADVVGGGVGDGEEGASWVAGVSTGVGERREGTYSRNPP